mmetsp:Transcript_79280/g.204201  ORF Transcript_79280/g.204201 Transcript_79280/m.204201 type:complete len:277 (+) Transcript_79280:1045-1875(+)
MEAGQRCPVPLHTSAAGHPPGRDRSLVGAPAEGPARLPRQVRRPHGGVRPRGGPCPDQGQRRGPGEAHRRGEAGGDPGRGSQCIQRAGAEGHPCARHAKPGPGEGAVHLRGAAAPAPPLQTSGLAGRRAAVSRERPGHRRRDVPRACHRLPGRPFADRPVGLHRAALLPPRGPAAGRCTPGQRRGHDGPGVYDGHSVLRRGERSPGQLGASADDACGLRPPPDGKPPRIRKQRATRLASCWTGGAPGRGKLRGPRSNEALGLARICRTHLWIFRIT